MGISKFGFSCSHCNSLGLCTVDNGKSCEKCRDYYAPGKSSEQAGIVKCYFCNGTKFIPKKMVEPVPGKVRMVNHHNYR